MVKTVEAQMRAAQPKARILSHFFSRASVLPEKAMAMQAELWQWMEGQTFTEASAVQMSCSRGMARVLRPTSSAMGRISRPLGSTI